MLMPLRMRVSLPICRGTTAGKMDDVLLSKLRSAKNRIDLGEKLHRELGLVNRLEPPPHAPSELGLAADLVAERENEGLLLRFGTYWLHAIWVGIYQIMHGDLPPTDPLSVASYGSCTLLMMVAMHEVI